LLFWATSLCCVALRLQPADVACTKSALSTGLRLLLGCLLCGPRVFLRIVLRGGGVFLGRFLRCTGAIFEECAHCASGCSGAIAHGMGAGFGGILERATRPRKRRQRPEEKSTQQHAAHRTSMARQVRMTPAQSLRPGYSHLHPVSAKVSRS